MKPAPFEYHSPMSLADALVALDHEDAKIIAGGQTLVPMMNFRLVAPERLVDINGIIELSRIETTEQGIRIGSLVRHAQAARDPLLAEAVPVIAEAMHHVAHTAIRNRGTMGGSLCHADPSAEWPLLATLLDGVIEIAGPSGKRNISPDAFFYAPLVTDLGDDEVLTGIFLPQVPAGTGMAFDEIAQRAGDFAVVACGATVQMEEDRIVAARLAFGGLGEVPVRADAVEQALKGAAVAGIADAVAGCAEGLEPIDDMHASASYRRALAPVLARRVLTKAARRATEGAGT